MEEPGAVDDNTTTACLSRGTCLICLAEGSSQDCLLWSSETNCSSSSRDGGDDKLEEEMRCLRRHLGSMFILRNLLDLSLEQCARVLATTGVNPGDWFFVCESCSKLVRAGFEIHVEVLELERKLERIREELLESLKDSLGRREVKKKGVGEGKVSEAHHLIRECFYERKSSKKSRPRKTRTLTKVVKKGVLMTGPLDTGEDLETETEHLDKKMEPLGAENEAHDNNAESDAGSVFKFTPEDLGESDLDEVNQASETLKGKRKSTSSDELSKGESPTKKARTTQCGKKRIRKIPEFPPNCLICGILNPSYNFYLDHKNAHANPDYVSKFKCDKCEFVGMSTLTTRRHLRDAHGEPYGRFACDKCDYVANRPYMLTRHMQSHGVTDNFELLDGELWIRCKLCGVEDTKFKMYSHMKSVHSLTAFPRLTNAKGTGGDPHLCHVCSKSFHRRRNLLDHIRSIHENKKRFFCDICGKGFMGKWQFEDHVASHTTPNVYSCSDCPLIFSTRSSLKTHYVQNHRQGLPAKPLEMKVTCKFCGVKLAHTYALAKHYKATHPDQLTYRCEDCELGFISRDGLQLHIKSKHSGRKFTCEYCFGSFSSLVSVRSHQRKHCKKRKSARSCESETVNSGDTEKASGDKLELKQ